jgi:hypothetical protein
MSNYVPEESGEKTRVIVHCGTWSDLSSTDVVAKLGKFTPDAVTYTGVGTTTSGHPGNRQPDYDFFNESPGMADVLMVGPGTLAGLGVTANVEDAFEQIRMDLESGEFRKFAFVGWSRGGKTSIDLQSMIDKLAEKGPLAKRPNGSFIRRQEVQFNAFLFDPVAMTGDSWLHGNNIVLPGFDNVVIAYAGAESRLMFPPLIPKMVSPYTSTLSVLEPWTDHRGVVDTGKSSGKLIQEIMAQQLKTWGVDLDYACSEDKMLQYALESIDEKSNRQKSARLGSLGGYGGPDVLPSPIDDHLLEMLFRKFPAVKSTVYGSKDSQILMPKLKKELDMPLGQMMVNKMFIPLLQKLPKKGSDTDPITFSVPNRNVIKTHLSSTGNLSRNKTTVTSVRRGLDLVKKLL